MTTTISAVSVDGILATVQRSNAAGEKARFAGAQAVQDAAADRSQAAREQRDQLEVELEGKQEARADHADSEPPLWDRIFGTKTYAKKDEALASDVERTETKIEAVEVDLEASRAMSKDALESMKNSFDDRSALDSGIQDLLRDSSDTQDMLHRGLRG